MSLELRIELSHTEPLIWRKVIVPSNATLDELHLIIQAAMGWENSHLHMFIINNKRYEVKFDDGPFPSEIESFDEQDFKIEDLVKSVDEFQYIYDFGDDWHHRIIVSAIADDDISTPKCVGGERACPPEDNGGPFGYPEFLDALADKKHPEHDHYSEWAGDFDPEKFNIDEANAMLSALTDVAGYNLNQSH